MIFALFLVLIGLVWLLSNLGLITTTVAQIIWPIILIAIGLTLLLKKKHRYFDWCCGWHEKEEEEEEKEKEKKEED